MGNTNMGAHNEPHKKSVGPIIGLIIILAIIVVGSLYFWSSRAGYTPEEGMMLDNQSAGETSVAEIQAQGSSDEFGAIEEDLNGFNEEDINSINTELEVE